MGTMVAKQAKRKAVADPAGDPIPLPPGEATRETEVQAALAQPGQRQGRPDFNEPILQGVERREPLAECMRVRDLGLDARSDAEILAHAATQGFVVLSHDVNTM